MTQNTQTTAERLFALIFENIGFTDSDDRTVNAIAAEIDALTAEVASKQETIDMLLEDERDAFRHERAQLEARLAEARAMASEREDFRLKQIADIRQERDAYREGYNRLTAQLAEAQAEVERLRLPAEAWEADEHYGNLLWSLPVERDTAQEEKLQQAATKRRETSDAAHAGARAREATRERRQELENELESVRDDFRKLTAERDAAREQIAGYEAGMRFQFDRAEDYKAQRDEARAEAREQIAALEASNAEQAQMMADGFADAKEQSAQLAEARAEIDRLRPAAEAFFLAEKKRRAAARARAAKVTP